MSEVRALEIVKGAIRDYRNWGALAQMRVGADEFMTAISLLEGRLDTTPATREEITISNRRYSALNAQFQKLKKRLEKLGGDTSADSE